MRWLASCSTNNSWAFAASEKRRRRSFSNRVISWWASTRSSRPKATRFGARGFWKPIGTRAAQMTMIKLENKAVREGSESAKACHQVLSGARQTQTCSFLLASGAPWERAGSGEAGPALPGAPAGRRKSRTGQAGCLFCRQGGHTKGRQPPHTSASAKQTTARISKRSATDSARRRCWRVKAMSSPNNTARSPIG